MQQHSEMISENASAGMHQSRPVPERISVSSGRRFEFSLCFWFNEYRYINQSTILLRDVHSKENRENFLVLYLFFARRTSIYMTQWFFPRSCSCSSLTDSACNSKIFVLYDSLFWLINKTKHCLKYSPSEWGYIKYRAILVIMVLLCELLLWGSQ